MSGDEVTITQQQLQTLYSKMSLENRYVDVEEGNGGNIIARFDGYRDVIIIAENGEVL